MHSIQCISPGFLGVFLAPLVCFFVHEKVCAHRHTFTHFHKRIWSKCHDILKHMDVVHYSWSEGLVPELNKHENPSQWELSVLVNICISRMHGLLKFQQWPGLFSFSDNTRFNKKLQRGSKAVSVWPWMSMNGAECGKKKDLRKDWTFINQVINIRLIQGLQESTVRFALFYDFIDTSGIKPQRCALSSNINKLKKKEDFIHTKKCKHAK